MREDFALISSAASGFFFCGIIDDPLENFSEILTKLNCEEYQITNSSENLLKCIAQIAEQERNYKAKSLAEVLSNEFAVGRSNPNFFDV